MRNEPGKRPLKGAGKGVMQIKSVRINTKNEPVVGRNIFQRARPCKGAKLTPWLWIGGTKEVRTLRKCEVILVDTGGKRKTETFYFVYPNTAIFVPDTEKYPFPWLIHLRENNKKTLIFKEKTLD